MGAKSFSRLKRVINSVKGSNSQSRLTAPIIIKKNGTKHILVGGDCAQILSQLPDDSVDLVITDPPYNVGLNYGANFNDRLPQLEYYKKSEKWLSEIARVLSKKGSLYLISYPEINSRFLTFLEDNTSLILRRWLTWHYPTNIGHSKKNFTRSQRSILFMTKDGDYTFNKKFTLQPYKNPDVLKIKKLILKGKKGRGAYDFLTKKDLDEIIETSFSDSIRVDLLKNVSRDRFTIWKGKKSSGHPCQLPLTLLKLLVLVSSNNNDIVLDPFGGTFTTSKAALLTGRNSIGIEINPKYIKMGIRRLSNDNKEGRVKW